MSWRPLGQRRNTSMKNTRRTISSRKVETHAAKARRAFIPGLSRYPGGLYSVPKMKPAVQRMLSQGEGPKMLILSALYGPLHPHRPIQDDNLMMQDAPARA